MEPASSRLPWEVIERVIGHSGDDRQSLINFSLTCPALRPRALCLLVADIHFQRREQIFNFCDFLQAKPHLKPLVRSIVVVPDEFSPFPLLSILPNLPKLRFIPAGSSKPGARRAVTVLNQSTLTCCERFGTQIQALHFSDLSFATYLDFARVLLTFANLAELVCTRVRITSRGNQAHLDVLKQHLSERLHLRTVNINYLEHFKLGKEYFYDRLSVANLLLDTGLVQSTVETLTVQPYSALCPLYTFNWPRLRLLVLEPRFSAMEIAATTLFLRYFPYSIPDVRVQFRERTIWCFTLALSRALEAVLGHLKALEEVLLTFRRPRIACLVDALLDTRDSFQWIQEIGQHVPELFQRGAFTITPNEGPVIPRAGGPGHDLPVSYIANSPDGKWVASGSWDSTIILWGATDGTIAQQWVAHSYAGVTSLAFSPDGRYLVSGGMDFKVKIWDVAEGSREIATLHGHKGWITCCAWSPCGDIIASMSRKAFIRLWDAHAFHALHVLECPQPPMSHIHIISFSPDGRWLASGSSHGYHLWNTASGTLHKSLPNECPILYSPCNPAAVFDPGSTRLLIAGFDYMVKVVDVETGEERAVLKECPNGARSVSFSPDGTLVLTGFKDGRMMLQDAHTGVELSWLHGHEKPVRQVCFSPCGRYVASSSEDSTVRLWRTGDGTCVATFFNRKGRLTLPSVVAFSPDGKTLWSGDWQGTVIMRRMRDVIRTEEQAL